MKERNYVNYDFYIQLIPGTRDYRAEVLDSPAGKAGSAISMPFNEIEQTEFLSILQTLRGSKTGMFDQKMSVIKKFGWDFFNRTFTSSNLQMLKASLTNANRQNANLVIRLRLAGLYELDNLPWEFIYLPVAESYLQLVRNIELIRFLEQTEQLPVNARLPLKVLVIAPNPADRPSQNLRDHLSHLNSAFSDLQNADLVVVEQLEHCNLPALRQKLQEYRPNIVHYIGYGEPLPIADGLLLFEDEAGNSEMISGLRLGDALRDAESVGLVVLDACDQLRTSFASPYGKSAASLVQTCVPAVIAMQLETSGEVAATLVRTVYRIIAEGQQINAALDETRRLIFESGSDIEWGTPALYTRVKNGLIFKFDSISGDRQKLLVTAPVYQDAIEAMQQQDWTTAIKHLHTVLDRYPGYTEAQEKLKFARYAQIEQTFQEGVRHYEGHEWEDARDNFVDAREQYERTKEEEEAATHSSKEIIPTELSSMDIRIADLDADAYSKYLERVASSSPTETSAQPTPQAGGSIGAMFKTFANQPAPAPSPTPAPAPAPIEENTGYRTLDDMMRLIEHYLAEIEKMMANRQRAVIIYRDALRLVDLRNWMGAIQRLDTVLQLDPYHAEAAAKRQEVDKLREWSDRYDDAELLREKGELEDALLKFQELAEVAGNFQNVLGRIADIKNRLSVLAELERLYQEGLRHLKNGEFTRALEKAKQILAQDPANSAAQQLRLDAQREVLRQSYDVGRQHLRDGELKEALEYFQQVKEQDKENFFPEIEEDMALVRARIAEKQNAANVAAQRPMGAAGTVAPGNESGYPAAPPGVPTPVVPSGTSGSPPPLAPRQPMQSGGARPVQPGQAGGGVRPVQPAQPGRGGPVQPVGRPGTPPTQAQVGQNPNGAGQRSTGPIQPPGRGGPVQPRGPVQAVGAQSTSKGSSIGVIVVVLVVVAILILVIFLFAFRNAATPAPTSLFLEGWGLGIGGWG
jgi:outer membrane protein assembly factor BamD (BamD/ComL family)